jgi:hypothetical protein
LDVINPRSALRKPCYLLVAPDVDDVLLPFWLAPLIGLNLTTGTPGRCRGLATGSPVDVMYCPVELELSDATESYRWPAVVGFTADPGLRIPAFGVAGGLQHFHTSLDFVHSTITLVPRRTLPASRHTVA